MSRPGAGADEPDRPTDRGNRRGEVGPGVLGGNSRGGEGAEQCARLALVPRACEKPAFGRAWLNRPKESPTCLATGA